MAYGAGKGMRLGGKGGGGLKLNSDMKGGGIKGDMKGKGKAGKQARRKV